MCPTEQLPGFELCREPADVPTPLAIAAADFCRRAGRKPTAEEVRLALARLHPSQDDALLAVVEAEPEALPLGPEALVDVVRGLPALEAAARESAGYYVALARAPRERNFTPHADETAAPALTYREAQRQEVLAALADARGDLAKTAKRLGLTDEALQQRLKRLSLVRRATQISKAKGSGATPPTVRLQGAKAERVRPSAPVPPLLPKRGSDRLPRGRLVLGTSATRDARELDRPEFKRELRELLAAYKGNRRQLLGRINSLYRPAQGKLDLPQLDAMLGRHGLRAEAEKHEVENLRYLFTQARGDLSAVAKRLKLAPAALKAELEERGLWAEAERMRDRYRRELFGRPLGDQIQSLLGQGRYLREMGALAALERQVRDEVERQWQTAKTSPVAERAARLAARLAVPESVARDLIGKFRLKP